MTRLSRLTVALMAVVLLGNVVLAQTLEPILVVKRPGVKNAKTEKLELAMLHVEARIFGHIAETKMTMAFRNPHDRALAGDLYFPLPEGSTISGYALDINGVMVDGVVIEKHRGRQVYEKIVRQGIDPGIVEWVKGNNFKTRVFPIPAKGQRKIMVKYLSDVTVKGGDAIYHLPLNYNRVVEFFKLRVEVVKAAAKPTTTASPAANFAFAKWREGFVAETALKDAKLDKDLSVALPKAATQKVLVEKAPDGKVYFCINDRPMNPTHLMKFQRAAPKRVAVLWDASGSRAKADHKRELDLLRAYFAQGHVRNGEVAVDLVVFRNAAAKPESFTIKNGNVDGLIARLKAVRYDGGTQMGSHRPPVKIVPDLYLLFTDGLSNFGKEEPEGLKAPVYAFSADATANHPFLRYVAMKTGGVYFNLNRVADAQAVAQIGAPQFAFVKVTAKGADADTLYPRTRQPVQGNFVLVGQLDGAAAEVALAYTFGGKGSYTVKLADAVEGDMLQRYWAQKKVQELSILADKNAGEIAATGKRYSIVTPGTSLIVLESLAQYVEHRVRPPKSLAGMRKKWEEIVEKQGRQKEKSRTEKLEQVVKMWQARVKWWGTEFKYAKDFKYVNRKTKGRARDAAAGGEAEGRPALRDADTPLAITARSPEPNAPLPGRVAAADPRSGRHLRSGGVDGKNGDKSVEPGIAIKVWDPKTPYLAALKAAPADKAFDVYMEQRAKYGDSPAFFLDCADFFLRGKPSSLGLQVLSNIAEMELENPALLRILAHRLAQLGELNLSVALFEQVLKLRPEEPQSYRDLALVLAQQKKYARAIELLYKVVLGHWDRFREVELIALTELNALVPKARSAGVKDIAVDARLLKLLDVDVRIIMTWDADLTDMDLWVTEPSGEKAYYGHRRTTIGGTFSRDFTQGYGPEEYMVRKAMRGSFKIQTNYYGSRAPDLAGAVTLQVDVFTNFGRANQKRKSITLRLTKKKEVIDIGEIEF
jgi:Ca-activated chloride channel homolog